MPGGWPFGQKLKKGDPVSRIEGGDQQTIYNIFDTIDGVGCTWTKTANGFGWCVTVGDSTGAGSAIGHFSIVPVTGSTVRVIGGSWTRLANDGAGRVATRVTMTVDAGTAGENDSYKELSISATTYVILTISADEFEPTSLVCSLDSNPYAALDDNNTVIVIGKVTWSGSEISKIDQFWVGDIEDQYQQIDELSLDWDAGKVIQAFGWATASDAQAHPVDDLFFYKDATNSEGAYSNVNSIGAALIGTGGAWNASTGSPPWAASGAVPHTNLDFTSPTAGNSLQNTNHDDRYWVHGSDYNTVNGGLWGQSIGRGAADDTPGTLAIDLTNSRLYDAAGATVSIDWVLRLLNGGPWTVNSAGTYVVELGYDGNSYAVNASSAGSSTTLEDSSSGSNFGVYSGSPIRATTKYVIDNGAGDTDGVGLIDADNADIVFTGGILVNENGRYESLKIRCLVDGYSGLQDVMVLGRVVT